MNTSTNSIPLPPTTVQQATHIVNALGINVTEEQMGAALGLGLFLYRWWRVEVTLIKVNGGLLTVACKSWTEFWGSWPVGKPKMLTQKQLDQWGKADDVVKPSASKPGTAATNAGIM